MIHGFETETAPLSKQELDLVPIFVTSLKTHIGKERAVTSSSIAEGIYKYCRVKIQGPRIRKIINHIRVNSLVPCLVSSSKGYYISNSQEEMEQYIASLKERSGAILSVAQALEGQKAFTMYNRASQ